MTAYIEKWIVDIGDTVKKGDLLATLFVPELVEDCETKKATVELDKEQIDLALKLVDVAAADVEAAKARLLEETEAILADYQVASRPLGHPGQAAGTRDGSRRRRSASAAGIAEPIESQHSAPRQGRGNDRQSEARALSEKRIAGQGEVDVDVARADLGVAESEVKRLEAWVGYLKLPCPLRRLDRRPQCRTRATSYCRPQAIRRRCSDAPYLSPSGSQRRFTSSIASTSCESSSISPKPDADYVHAGDERPTCRSCALQATRRLRPSVTHSVGGLTQEPHAPRGD